MASLCFKAFLLISLLLLSPFSYGMVDSFYEDGMQQAKYSLEKVVHSYLARMFSDDQLRSITYANADNGEIFPMKSTRKLLMAGAMLDYDDTGANTKHDPRKKPGKP